jgi:hypothetical protein
MGWLVRETVMIIVKDSFVRVKIPSVRFGSLMFAHIGLRSTRFTLKSHRSRKRLSKSSRESEPTIIVMCLCGNDDSWGNIKLKGIEPVITQPVDFMIWKI